MVILLWKKCWKGRVGNIKMFQNQWHTIKKITPVFTLAVKQRTVALHQRVFIYLNIQSWFPIAKNIKSERPIHSLSNVWFQRPYNAISLIWNKSQCPYLILASRDDTRKKFWITLRIHKFSTSKASFV